MKTLGILALVFAFSTSADVPKNPVERYFKPVPLEEAHVTWGAASEGKLPSLSLDVLIWNVKKGDKLPFDMEFRRLGTDKELFLIQEAYTAPFFTGTIDTFANYQWELGLSFRYRMYNNEATGNMIGAMIRPSWVKVEHSLNVEPLTETPKTTVYAKYAVEALDKELLVISIHGINFNGLNAYVRQLGQVEAVVASHDGPVILAGDFNTRSNERQKEIRVLAKKLGLKEVKFLNDEIRMTAFGSKHFLDHAFIRGFKINHAEVHPSPGSDHQPMSLNLDFL